MIKRFLLVVLFAGLTHFVSFSQSHELRLGITSGVSNFTGSGSDARSTLNGGSQQEYYTNNPYGKKYGINLGGALNYRYVFANNVILGLEGAFERLQTKIDLQGNEFINGSRGQTKLNQQFVNFNPFVGYRVGFEPMTMDIQIGMDVSKTLSIKESGSIEDKQGNKTSFDRDRGKVIDVDLRPRLQFNVNYERYTVFAGYSWGLKDYNNGLLGADPGAARLNVFRLGLQYQLLTPIFRND
ncbi:hypothetical protein [Sphingobacterium sp.]|uniref:hypothetical protein n=1 Tax=Sphingobacterium sp. TaxID=341027 RepID=UPI00289A35DC|nr:hypothetical protein [Sphingobacterium sp.]